MKTNLLAALFLTVVLLCGCSSTKFTEYHGSTVFQGAGGAMRSVDDIDIWEGGEPDRKYQVLGFIEASHGHHVPLGHFSRLFSSSGEGDSAIAKLARKHGGNAVILVGGNRAPASDDDDVSEGRHPRIKRIVVIKYVE